MTNRLLEGDGDHFKCIFVVKDCGYNVWVVKNQQ